MPNSLADLLADAGFVNRLARSLTANAEDAADLAQETRLRALQRPPQDAVNPRGWVRRVMQNCQRQWHRADRRRHRREEACAVDATVAPMVDLVERAAAHRAVVDAVVRLAEPYRTVVLLRFFEGEAPRAIAARLGVSVATVHTRLTRAFAHLRRDLDAARGPRSVWCAALLPLPSPRLTVPLFGFLAMKSKFVVAAAAVLGSVSVLWFGSRWYGAEAQSHPDPAVEPAAHLQQETPVARTAEGVGVAEAGGRSQLPAPPAARPAPAPALRALSGRVVDTEGRALPELAVGVRGGEPARTDAGGNYRLPLPAGAGSVVVAEPEWNTVMACGFGAGEPPVNGLVVAGRALHLAGTVRTPEGAAVADARVQVVWPEDLRARLGENHDAALLLAVETRTGADGTFQLEAALARGAQLLTTAQGWVPDRRPLPEFSDRALAVTLASAVGVPGHVSGQVVDRRGLPVAGASVGLGSEHVRSDAEGRFSIPEGRDVREIIAAARGHRAARVPRPAGGFGAFVLLELGDPPLAIGGRVLDGAGRGVAGAKVWVMDATLLSGGRDLAVTEGVAGGAMTFTELRAALEGGRLGDPEAALRTTPTAAWPFAVADAAGHFQIGGLEARGYELRAMDARTLLMHDVGTVVAGTRDLVIRMPDDAVFARVAGQVLAGNGQPVAGVTVRVQCDPVRVATSNLHDRCADLATTDAEGRFELAGVAKARAYLRLDGESILPLEYGRGVAGGLLQLAGGDATNLRITVAARVHVKVELQDPAGADAVAVLDGQGEVLPINVFVGRGRRTDRVLRLAEGRSDVFVVPDTAATLVLYLGEREVGRHVLALRNGEVNTVRL